MSPTEPRAPGQPGALDYTMWLVVSAAMMLSVFALTSAADKPLAWLLFGPAIAFGAMLMWRRWRFVRDGVPHI